MNHAIEFFDRQFVRQTAAKEYALKPFEQAALPHLGGKVLDFGFGMGHLSMALARKGCDITAIDADFPAPESTLKRCHTPVARSPAEAA